MRDARNWVVAILTAAALALGGAAAAPTVSEAQVRVIVRDEQKSADDRLRALELQQAQLVERINALLRAVDAQ